jgi:hypothetical protein
MFAASVHIFEQERITRLTVTYSSCLKGYHAINLRDIVKTCPHHHERTSKTMEILCRFNFVITPLWFWQRQRIDNSSGLGQGGA